MSESLLFHNPGCSKSRAALALLQERGVQPRIVAYLEQPLTASNLEQLLAALDAEPRAILRVDEPEFHELGLADPALDRSALVDALVRHPRLLQRPIFVHRGRAVIGRPPERVLELLA